MANPPAIVDAAAPTVPGVVPAGKPWWARVQLGDHLLVLLLSVVGVGYLIVRGRKQIGCSPELVGLGVAGLVLGAAFRFSSTLGAFYGPERGALVIAFLVAVPVALLLDRLADSWPRMTAVVAVALAASTLVTASGLAVVAFGGDPVAALSAQGEAVERFTVSTPEVGTAIWLQENVPKAPMRSMCGCANTSPPTRMMPRNW